MLSKPRNFGKSKKQTKAYQEIQQHWKNIQSLEIKNRFKAMRTLAHDICETYANNKTELSQLEFYIEVLNQINRIHDLPRSKRTLSKMIVDWLELTGNANAKIIKKISGKINLETASISICDRSFIHEVENAYANYTEKNVLNLVNEGKVFVFSTGADGIYNVQARIIEGLEPVLSAKEFKCVVNTAEITVIHCPTGSMMVGDPCCLNNEKECMLINVKPGNYKVCVYHFFIRNKIDSFYMVLCKTDNESNNNITKLAEFG